MALLLEVRGITETKRTWWGTLNRASDAAQKFSRSVSSVATPARATTQATPTSPHLSSGTPTTDTSATAGWENSTLSTSAGQGSAGAIIIAGSGLPPRSARGRPGDDITGDKAVRELIAKGKGNYY